MASSIELSAQAVDQSLAQRAAEVSSRSTVGSSRVLDAQQISAQAVDSGNDNDAATDSDLDLEVSAQIRRLGNVKLAISIDESANQPVIRIFDQESGNEMIQIPAEYSLTISQTIQTIAGALFDKKV